MADSPFDVDDLLVRKLAGLLDETKLTEIEYAWGDHRIRVTRQPAAIHAVGFSGAAPAASSTAAPAGEAAAAVEDLGKHPGAVKSPMVGTVYMSPQPGSPPFVRAGDTIAAGQPLLIIEAMKVMNQIRAPKAGRLTRILVGDAGPVEFDQVIMLIE